MSQDEKECRDIAKALEESEKRLKAIIDSAVDGIITIDSRGIIQSINQAILDLFLYSRGELIGRNISMLMPEPESSRHDTYIEKYQKTRKANIIGIGREVKGKKKDNSLFPFKLSVSEVQLEKETIYTGIIHDLTEQKKAEQELHELNSSLERKVEERTERLSQLVGELQDLNISLNREIEKRQKSEEEVRALLEKEIELGTLKSRFVSMASHEFRTPLSGILSSASLISRYKETEEDEKREKHIRNIRSSVEALNNILNEFLSLETLQTGKVAIHPSDFDVDELVEEVCENMGSLLKEGRGFHIQHEGESGMHSDRNILQNILTNLVSNAIKYSYPDTPIIIRSSGSKTEMTIEVEDKGIGIPEADKKHMYERFFRAHNATNIKGTGLGLNIVTRYLELLHGSIGFESQESIGTTFRIRIPRTRHKQFRG